MLLVVKNGSNARWRVSSSMPDPVSRILMETYGRLPMLPESSSTGAYESSVETSRCPPAGMASRELTTMLKMTCSNWVLSIITVPAVGLVDNYRAGRAKVETGFDVFADQALQDA